MIDTKPTAPSSLHVVYCLTSSGGDLYEAMTRVSLATVRLTNPTARIEIACDQQTHQALHATGSQLLREADAVHGFPTPDGPPTFRNRFVKTQLRLLLSGPFLFLDSDTVVRKPLTPLLNLQTDIAAAPNHSADTLAEQIWSEDQANLDTMGWQVREPYVNGGVIWYADTPAAHRFAEAWHRNWLANVECTGRYRDQPALNFSLSSSVDLRLVSLDHPWNAQYACRPEIASNAIIWHTHASQTNLTSELFNISCLKIKSDNALRPGSKLIARLVTSKSPWPIKKRSKGNHRRLNRAKNTNNISFLGKMFKLFKCPRKSKKRNQREQDKSSRIKILAIGHEASLTGAPLLLLSYLKSLSAKRSAINYRILLARGGHLLGDYQASGDTFVDGPKSAQSLISIHHTYTAARILLGIDIPGWKLGRWLNKEPTPNAIYVNTVASIFTLNRVLSRLANKPPIIIHVHELDFILKQCNLDGSTSAALHQAERIIVPSEAVAKALQNLFAIPEEKIVVINEWIIKPRDTTQTDNTNRNAVRNSMGLSASDTLCIGVGRMQWRKGSDLLPLLAKYCIDHSRTIHIGWIGLGSWEQVEQIKIESLKLGAEVNLHLLGEKEDPYPYYSAADIFILPSREDPYPVAMLEAALFKLPIICFDQSGGTTEFINSGAGVSVKYMDIPAFASEVYRLSCQPSLRRAMGEKGAAAIHSSHLVDNAGTKITRLLKQAAQKNNTAK